MEKKLQYTFKNKGLGIYNDDVFENPSFNLINNEYTFILEPNLRTKFWRFGLALSKTENFELKPIAGRYNNPELKFIEINVGEKTEAIWHLPNRIGIGSYHIDGFEGHPRVKEVYIEYSPVKVDLKYNSGQHISISYFSAPAVDSQSFPINEHLYFKLFAWADETHFEIKCEIIQFSQNESEKIKNKKNISTSKRAEWEYIVEKEMKERTGKLDLCRCGLTIIPDQLEEMLWLKTLILGNGGFRFTSTNSGIANTLTSEQISNKIVRLTNLTKIHLGSLQLEEIPNIASITQLEVLDLSANKIKRITGLENFKKLKKLYLIQNNIIKIEGLQNLVQLYYLTMDSNEIEKIEGLENLKKLQTLYLAHNKISRIEGLDNLKLLTSISLSFNQITKLSGLNRLNVLRSLSLTRNSIAKIEGLENLKLLLQLDLANNQINKIEGLENLKGLSALNISNNQILNIEGLVDLVNLKSLQLNNNKIKEIADLGALSNLTELVLYDNPVENINLTILGSSNKANCINDLKNFFAEQVEIYVPEVKLILTGNSDVGKTKFRIYLTTGKYDKTRSTTHGLEVYQYPLDEEVLTQYNFEKNTQIFIWDFGGQEYFHNTHQLFFNQHAVYVFFWEKDTNKNEPVLTEIQNDTLGNKVNRVLEHFDTNYWLSNIRHFAQDAAIIPVQNKVDKYYDRNEPLEWLPHETIVKYSCGNQYHISISKSFEKDLNYWFDFEKLKHALFSKLKAFVSANKEGYVYNQVRKEIDRLKNENYWTVENFIQFIEDVKTNSKSTKVADIDNRLVVEHFCRQGKVLYPLNQILEKGNVIFTNPQWVSKKIYEILNDEVLQRNGFFYESDLRKLITSGGVETYEILTQLIELMRQYNIVFFDPHKKQYVAPQYLPEVPTVHYSQVKKLLSTPQLIIKVEGFMPKSVINNILARYAVKDDSANYYKYGVKSEIEKKDILLIEFDYSSRKIYVYSDSKELLFIRNVFEDILSEFGIKLPIDTKSLGEMGSGISDSSVVGANDMVTTDNNIYISVDDKIFVNWSQLWNESREADMDRDYIVAEDGNMVLRKMFLPYFLPNNEVKNINHNTHLKPNKLFISYSSKNTDFMHRFITHLEPLKRNGTIEFWYDRMIEPGTKWDDSIKLEMKTSDLVIFLLSPDFIATNYIFEFEIPQAIKQMESKNSNLFFIELQSCSWHRTVLSRFQQSTDPTSDNKGVIVIGDAMNDNQWKKVVDELEKKIKK